MIEQEPESYVDRIKRFKGVLVHKSTGKLWYKGSKSKERTKTMKILNVTTRAKNSFKYTDAHKFYPLYVQVGDSLVNAEGENFKIRFIGKTISCDKTKPNFTGYVKATLYHNDIKNDSKYFDVKFNDDLYEEIK